MTGTGPSVEVDPDRSLTLRKDLRAIYGEGLGFSLMVGLGETYVPAFALAVGMGEVAAGWIVSAPLLVGALLQLVSPMAVRRLGSHRSWVVLCAGGQAACCAGYLLLALAERVPHLLVFVVAALYWGTGMASGPAWNTWVGTLIPAGIRARFLAWRARGCQAAVLVGLVAGGFSLQLGAAHGNLLTVFAWMFLIAALGRAASAWLLSRQSEPQPVPINQRTVSPRELLRRARHGADGRLLVYMLAVQAAVQVAAPFFTPFMLVELNFSYTTYLLLIATAYVAKMVAFPFLGSMAKRFGSHWLLYASGVANVPLSALWIVSDSIGYLLALQVFAGVVWAGYEFATLLLFFEHIPESERTSVLTLFNLGNAAALVLGAVIGGILLKTLGTGRDAYHLVFGLSCGLRLLALIPMVMLRRVTFRPVPFVPRVHGVRPNAGSIGPPLVTSLGEEAEDSSRPR